ncbi:MAG: cation-translocating P-type ATPase [Defluviitaleaceae bacterium]|nr:cation-translocating P-type ATPase [Defluviitaleaceae bacterium]
MLWVKETLDEVLGKLNVDATKGLGQQEVKKRINEFGLNEFAEEKKETLLQKVFHHLTEITAIILMIAAGVAAYMAITAGEGWAKVVVILSIVAINTILGVYQENKAEQALEALKKLNTAKTTVIRDGNKQQVEADQLVPGDIVVLTAGDVITADARLLEASSLQVCEAGLTGESEPVEKDPNVTIAETVPLGDRLNMVYSGCLVTGGRATAVVVETAMNTEMGKIASLLSRTKKTKTPLQIRLKQLATRLCLVAIFAGILMFAIGHFYWGNAIPDMLLVGISLGVAAVPETLPIIVTMILSVSVHTMVTKKTIIRKMVAVETVGNTSVICSDKTGTLTQNRMTIQQIWHVGKTPTNVTDDFTPEEQQMIEKMASCCNAHINIIDGEEKTIGDPTELAMMRLSLNKGVPEEELIKRYPRVHELPFDSGRKLMTTVHKMDDHYLSITKGAFDRIPVAWNDSLKKEAVEVHDSFANRALRVIALGYKKYDELPTDLSENELEKDLMLMGLVGMIDPPRPESKEAVARAKEAGISTVMITGDHIGTAKAIAKEIGIYEDGDRALTGDDLNVMSEEDLKAQVRDVSVYARVSPEDKIRIVNAWQSYDEVIAMTGDGVNDAPALKAADVGAAMGITGTEVSKSAADMVITDDNFATIVEAINQGRITYDNIRKTVYFLLSVNFAQIFIMLSSMIIWGHAAIIAVQILLINVVSDGLPGFFLAFEKEEPGIMTRKPLSKDAGIFANRLGMKIAQRSITFSILTLTAFIIGFYELIPAIPTTNNVDVAITMAFLTLSFASVINIFNVRSELSIFKVGFLSNPGVFYASLASIGITVAIALIPPLANVFDVVALTPLHWLIVALLSSMQVVTVEIQKFIANRNRVAYN